MKMKRDSFGRKELISANSPRIGKESQQLQ